MPEQPHVWAAFAIFDIPKGKLIEAVEFEERGESMPPAHLGMEQLVGPVRTVCANCAMSFAGRASFEEECPGDDEEDFRWAPTVIEAIMGPLWDSDVRD